MKSIDINETIDDIDYKLNRFYIRRDYYIMIECVRVNVLTYLKASRKVNVVWKYCVAFVKRGFKNSYGALRAAFKRRRGAKTRTGTAKTQASRRRPIVQKYIVDGEAYESVAQSLRVKGNSYQAVVICCAFQGRHETDTAPSSVVDFLWLFRLFPRTFPEAGFRCL